jgi:5-formyltetrahydrofolate cyclo-ligase
MNAFGVRYHLAMPTPSFDPAPSAGSGLRAAKDAVRARILREREGLSAETRAAASGALVAALAARRDFRAAATVLLTLPFRSEWDTRPLFVTALAAGKTVAAPRVNRATRMLEAYAVAVPDQDTAPGYRGIPEPRGHCPPVAVAAVDWVLVPGVAFDERGRRIGYGGGYYDRLLPLLRPDTRRIAGAYELQVVDRVPAAPHDLTVDAIVTELRTIEAAR